MKAEASAGWRFAPAQVFAHVRARLSLTPDRDWRKSGSGRLRPAAVLVGLADNPDEVGVILTQRTAALRVHSGQIAFPGGKIDARDKNADRRSLARGARGNRPRPGALSSRSAFLTLRRPEPAFASSPWSPRSRRQSHLTINPGEVDEAFEVPFAFLMDSGQSRAAP